MRHFTFIASRLFALRAFIAALFIAMPFTISAQELKCQVTINSDQIEGSNKQMFETLKQSIDEYVNQNRWTNMTVMEQEKIECSMMITVKQVTTDGLWTCSLQLQSRRPVFNTTYMTPVLNFMDQDFNFKYQEFDRLEWQQATFTTNLTAMLAFYVYLIIGYDLDTYQRMGGTPMFQQCENIVNLCQSASMDGKEQNGWMSFGSNRSRYRLVNNLMDEAFRDYRGYMYDYHRLGLDQMAANVANGRAKIAEGIDVVRAANRARPATYVVQTFLDAKSDEIVELFKQGTASEKKKVREVMEAVDPTRSERYEEIGE